MSQFGQVPATYINAGYFIHYTYFQSEQLNQDRNMHQTTSNKTTRVQYNYFKIHTYKNYNNYNKIQEMVATKNQYIFSFKFP